MSKVQRVRDPLHDLIEFHLTDFEQGLWNVLNSKEYLRLRRIKQLGFSELVYPGATHTRFAHSIGVFQTARQLVGLVARIKGAEFDEDRARVAMASALVHDVGHGPFSHAFESALKGLDKLLGEKKAQRHEVWTARIIREDTDLGGYLATEKSFGPDVRDAMAKLLLQEAPTDIYSALISSQLDADRLDYIRRDRMMSGAQHGGFDYSWLLANLEVDKVSYTTDGETYAHVDTLIIGRKAFQAAEAYVLGLFHMYFAVYFHKATRSAEKMMSAILLRVGQLVAEKKTELAELSQDNPLVEFLKTRSLGSYLEIDDSIIWANIRFMTRSKDAVLSDLSNRLLDRRLYKAIDVASALKSDGKDVAMAEFRALLSDAKASGEFEEFEIFEDRPSRSPYDKLGYDTPEALSRVLIRQAHGGKYEDLAKESEVVGALQEKSIFRVYVRDEGAKKKIEAIIKETMK